MINFHGDPSQDGYSPLPPGDYFLTVTEAEEQTSKSGRDMVKLELTVSTGPYADKKSFLHWLTFIEAGSPGHGITLHALHAFGFPTEGAVQLSAKDFEGRTVKAKVGVETYQGKERNKVEEFYVLTDGEMTKEAFGEEPKAAAPANPAPAPAPARQPVGAGAGATRKLPWKK